MIELKLNPAQDNWLEATWTDVVQLPDVHHPAQPALFDVDGKEVRAAVPESVTPGEIVRTELKHTSYHPTQLNLLQADAAAMGTPLDAHTDMLAAWVASYVPPPPEPIQIPKSVTMRQARIALSKRSLLTTVQSAIQNSNDEVLKIEWEYATEIKRDWPTLKAIATLLSFTEDQLDELFLEASQL